MPNVVFCDNKDCIFYDDYHECCHADKLVIECGLCMGTPRSGRNVSENDLDEKLKFENVSLKFSAQKFEDMCDKYKEENAKLRELLQEMVMRLKSYDSYENDMARYRCRINGIKVDK